MQHKKDIGSSVKTRMYDDWRNNGYSARDLEEEYGISRQRVMDIIAEEHDLGFDASVLED